MPFYDFKCKDCENEFTIKVSSSELDEVVCPECNSENVKQKFSAFSIGKGSTEASNSTSVG